jgi:phosphoribosylaminoimidazole carboxylase PurE protein
MARIALLMGSDSDLPKLKGALETLRDLEEAVDVRVISAHRTPADAHAFGTTAREKGYQVILCAAGGAAHLAGVIASLTPLPVIGIPVNTDMAGGLDSLLSTAQMPPGVPVATVGSNAGGPANAALLAARILALVDESMRMRLDAWIAKQADKIRTRDKGIAAKVKELLA